ncbi:periplasmic binding protein-like II [Anaeromyces robustus]|uniref:Periplasmic binding protein-like II n=1 Tax=Anaeromyces robustus TaxID=1754192 RepID=A0A1Y1X8F4_9FUNG|nr:periplasmic binding protein-like II [Anaeromyces robustus]|eukprot:ORX82035.1 periplasmic binding protein-like II [Anaeromyces robustus]
MKSIIFLLLLLTLISIGRATVEITIYGFFYVLLGYEHFADEINEYFKQNGIDVVLKTAFETQDDTSGDPKHIANAIESYLQKKDKGYDLFITDTVYTGRFAKHFEDLEKYVKKDIVADYKEGTATSTCIVDDRLVALPLYVDYGGLYANTDLLNKYQRPIPETWDELIETENIIYNGESKIDPNFHRYLAHFPEYENGLVTLLEFLHSFRDGDRDHFPEYTSKNAALALEKMREVKEKASTNDDFGANEPMMNCALTCGNYAFLRFWYVGEAPFEIPGMKEQCNCPNAVAYNRTFNHLPGKKPGISASCVGGNNISMNRYISEERKRAAVEVINYLTSYDKQKKEIIQNDKRSAIHRTYSDTEICEKINCPKFSTMQGIVRPSSSAVNYEEYSDKFRDLARKYIYRETDQTAEEILVEIDDIRKIHYVELTSLVSIIMLSLAVITILLIFSAYIYISIKRFRKQFVFLSFNYWCMFIFGLFIVVCYCFTGVHRLSSYNCLIRPFLLSFGFTLIYVPIFLKLISIFPSKNGISKFVKDHFSLSFICFLIIDVVLNIVWFLLDPLIVNKFMVTSGKNFQYCSTSKSIGPVIKYVFFGYKLLILLIMCILVFAEWNLAAFKPDIRSVTTTIYTNILLIAIFIIVERINIDNRYMYYALRSGIVLIFCLSTLAIIIGSKFYQLSLRKDNPYPDISSFNKSSSGGMDSSRYYQSNRSFNNSSSNQFSQNNKMNLLSYHYQTGTPDGVINKDKPNLFSASFNNSYNGNLFTNSSNSHSSESFTNSKYSNSKSYLNNYNSNNYSSNNYNSNNYSNNNYNFY